MQSPYTAVRFPTLTVNAGVIAIALTLVGCGSSGNTVTSPSALSKCAVAVDAPASTLPAAGATGAIAIKTERECQWTAQPEVNWLSITAGASGQGDGAVQFNAAANNDPVTRSGGVMVNGQRAQVTQAGAECRFELASTSASFGQVGGNGSAEVRASSALCTWTASSDAEWIAITSNATGKGTAAVAFTVASTTGAPRTGTLTIAGLHFNVTQAEGCTYSVAPLSYATGAAGGSQAVTITAGPGCPWTASSNADWITVTPPAGAGPGSATVTVASTAGPSRTASLTIAGQSFAVTQSPGCSFEVSPLSHSVDASGGTRAVNVTTTAGCEWSASSTQPWLTITAGSSGNGSGTVTFSAAALTGPPRSGALVVAGQTVTVSQANGCAFTVSPDSQSVPAGGGNGSTSVTTGAGCTWTAKSNASWITVTSGASGSGDGTVNFTVASTTGPSRSGTLTIAGRTFTVNQGQGCTISLASSSASVPAGGGTGTFDVRTADGCGWAAADNASWLSITGGASGSGNGTVHYSASANTGPQRTGTITAGGQTFTVTQAAGCSYSISPASQNVGSGGGNAAVAVTVSAGCSWNASSNAGWITIGSGGSGSGNGSVQLAVAANSDGERRGTVTIAGETATIIQASGCAPTISPASQSVPAGGASGSFNVNAAGGCAWTATPRVPWITLTSGGSGTGGGTVQFTVAPNSSAARSGTITAAGQTFTVNQESGCSAVVAPDTIAEPAAGGPQSVTVTTAPDCSWTAASNAPWLAVSAGASGTGNGNVQLAIQSNAGPARSGTATIAGRTVIVNQDSGCVVTIDPTSQAAPAAGGPGSVTITTTAGCTWTAVSNAPWIHFTSPESGAGGGTVAFAVDPTTAARSGTISISGQVFTVNQAGM
jgi:Viral BACON domain/Putative binding domain, N-terminal